MKRQCKHLAVFLGLNFLWLGLSAQHECIWVSVEEDLLDITHPSAKADQPKNLAREIQVLLSVDPKLNKSFEVLGSKIFKKCSSHSWDMYKYMCVFAYILSGIRWNINTNMCK